MKKNGIRDKAVVLSFLCIVYALFFINILKPATELSYSERRKLAQLPRLTAEAVWSAEFMEGFDSYAVDQMAFRETFRRVKAVFDRNILRKSDSNGIFIAGDMIFKTEYPLNEKSVVYLCDRINYVYEKYLNGGMNVRFSMVPDKNYYIENPRHLVMDYRALETLIRGNIRQEIGYIDLFGALSLDCYYRTDAHWRQEKIGGVAETVAGSFGVSLSGEGYTQESYYPFYGVYYGQSALDVEPDTITYLTGEVTEKALVSSIEQPGEALSVYNTGELGGMDSYNLFMAGPAAVVTARNPLNPSGRELIVFRDSYGSSLSPLLLEGYGTVTLIDLRYIHPDVIGEYAAFTDQDVLFLYSATLFNNSGSIK